MFDFIFIAKLDGAQKLQCLLRDQGFLPINSYNAQKAEEACFIYPSWRCINHVEFLMRSINLKRRELYQNLNLPKQKSLVLKYPTELPITLLRGRMCTHWKALSEVICPGNVSVVYEKASQINASITRHHLLHSWYCFNILKQMMEKLVVTFLQYTTGRNPAVFLVQAALMCKHKISTKNSFSMSPFCKLLRTSVSSDGEECLCQARLQLERKSCCSK